MQSLHRPGLFGKCQEVFHGSSDLRFKGALPCTKLRSQHAVGGRDDHRVEIRLRHGRKMLPCIDIPRKDLGDPPTSAEVRHDVKRLPCRIDNLKSLREKLICHVVIGFPYDDDAFLGNMLDAVFRKSLPNDGRFSEREHVSCHTSDKFAVQLTLVRNAVFLHIRAAHRAIVPKLDVRLVSADVKIGCVGKQLTQLIKQSLNARKRPITSRADEIRAHKFALLRLVGKRLGAVFDQYRCVSRHVHLRDDLNAAEVRVLTHFGDFSE